MSPASSRKRKDLSFYHYDMRIAYLKIIGYISKVDCQIDDREIAFLQELFRNASLTEEEQETFMSALDMMNETDLKSCLDLLEKSDIRFSLINDMVNIMYADGNASEIERETVENIVCRILSPFLRNYSVFISDTSIGPR